MKEPIKGGGVYVEPAARTARDEVRKHLIAVRLTRSERSRLKKAAAVFGVTVSEVARLGFRLLAKAADHGRN